MEPAFLAAIHAEPHSDTPALVFADWLDERGELGDAERAEFIRLSVAEPGRTFWQSSEQTDRASELAATCWHDWMATHRARLGDSSFARWIAQGDCRWGYRRGFVAAFESDVRVLSDARTDLFVLGPVEEIIADVPYLSVAWELRQFLTAPCLTRVHLRSWQLTENCVSNLELITGWLRRLGRVELSAREQDAAAADRLRRWLRSDSALAHVSYRRARR